MHISPRDVALFLLYSQGCFYFVMWLFIFFSIIFHVFSNGDCGCDCGDERLREEIIVNSLEVYLT